MLSTVIKILQKLFFEMIWCRRRPELLVAASSCALLLRLSLVSMQGASGLPKGTIEYNRINQNCVTSKCFVENGLGIAGGLS